MNSSHVDRTLVQPSNLRRSRFRRALQAVSLFLVFFFGTVLLLLWWMGVFGGNIRTAVPGQLYRSAQLTGHNLVRVIHRDHIRSIINLRGAEISDSWYHRELATSRTEVVRHFDVALSAEHLPPPRELAKLVHDFDTAPRPILIHCMGGADRSGLAATLFEVVEDHQPLDLAERRDLTWHYGHLSFGKAHAMDDFFNLYRKTSSGMDLRNWIYNRYPDLYKRMKHS